jgi:hypothetical protein
MSRFQPARLEKHYRALLTAGTILLGGCYTYRPLSTAQPAPGTRVSAELTGDGARELSGQVGPEVAHVEGEVLVVDSNGVEIAVRQIETTRGIQSDWKGEKVTIPSSAVSGWQQRRLSVGGTGFLGGLVAGGLYAMYRLLGGPGLIDGRGGGTGPGGGAN